MYIVTLSVLLYRMKHLQLYASFFLSEYCMWGSSASDGKYLECFLTVKSKQWVHNGLLFPTHFTFNCSTKTFLQTFSSTDIYIMTDSLNFPVAFKNTRLDHAFVFLSTNVL